MGNKDKRPAYFCFFLEACEMISLLDVEKAGRVIHAISSYFGEGTKPEGLNREESIVFNRIKRDVDRSFEKYNDAVSNGKKGAEKRYGSSSEPESNEG